MTKTKLRRIEFTVPEELGEQYDRARGDVPMAAWIKRALESALGDHGVPPHGGESTGASPARESAVPASSRAPKKPSLADTWRR